ncbi:WSC domain-containing protein [Cercophora samala]|uniref:WSC domain-containing protein n=1 Tax=Cercophora samala TaxID=330535 RepID=A0AA39ZAF7_9PEZI|nr:WSC domain-containing protein [Cercophora samala]
MQQGESTYQGGTSQQTESQSSKKGQDNLENHASDGGQSRPTQGVPHTERPTAEEPKLIVATSSATSMPTDSADGRLGGWKNLGCYADSEQRILRGGIISGDNMTNSLCAEICSDSKFKYFGTEHGNECMCGESAAEVRGSAPGDCDMGCNGTPLGSQWESCGGFWFLNLWQRR